jgi:acyl-CoA thioesterase I
LESGPPIRTCAKTPAGDHLCRDHHRPAGQPTNILNNDPVANVAAIKSKLAARGIKVIDAMPIYISLVGEKGMSDYGVHLSVEGNKKLATILAGML